MSSILDIRYESLAYTARFARPPFELWGAGGKVVREIYEALAPYKVTLRHFQLSSSISSAADTIVTVQMGTTVLKFSFEKIEVSFSGFSDEEFRGIPKFLQLSTGWLGKEFQFASHEVAYFMHSVLKEKDVDEFLGTINPNPIKSAGINLGDGAIFNRAVPDKSWITQLTIDRSQHVPGALFIGLNITIVTGLIRYESLLVEAREYFANAIGELGLAVPDLAGQE